MPVLDPYEVLGVEPTVTCAEVQAAFRSLAMQWHPDRNQLPEATAKFRDIHEAYQCLRDPVARAAYDAQQPQARRERWEARDTDPCCPECEHLWREACAAVRVTPAEVISVFDRIDGLLRRAFGH